MKNCQIQDCQIKNSIIMYDARIGAFSYISNSIIGSHNSIGSHFITQTGENLLLEINGVPDLSQLILSQGSNMKDLLEAATNKNSMDFRDWFHKNQELNEKEILREYLGVLQQVPSIQKLPSKILRFVITSVLGYVPVLGQAVSFFDSFIIDRLFKGSSPKFFIDDLTNVTGSLELQQKH